LLSALVLPAARALDEPKPPAEQYKALVAEYQKAQEDFRAALQEAKTPEERQKVIQEKQPQPDKFAGRFLELAEKNAKDPVAVEALVWVVSNTAGQPKKDSPRTQAIELIRKNHLESDKLEPMIARLSFSNDKDSEALLQAIAEKNPHREVQGQAVFGLAQQIQNQLRLADRIKNQPQLAKLYEQSLGEDYVKALREMDAEKKAKEAEQLYQRVVEKYADLKAPRGGTIGKVAEGALKALRNPIVVGKPAPEIEGEDIDAKAFKLSDYKGKVVLLDFWGHW
jgi:hypothetical protein